MSQGAAVRSLVVIAGREVSERAALLGLAVVLAAVPFAAPRVGLADRPLLASFLWIVMSAAAAVLTGSSVIARDLAEGRLGFFFARPIPWWSIWGGKLLAAVVLTFAAGSIVLAPSLLSDDASLPASGSWIRILTPAILALVGAAHALAVGYRSRTPWFALDLVLAGGLAWFAARTTLGLLWSGAVPGITTVASVGFWVLAVALTVASAAQVALGRADIRRGHHVLSTVLWSLLVPTVAFYTAWGWAVGRPVPRDIAHVTLAVPAPGGTWVAVAGRLRPPRPRSMMPSMLLNLRSGRFLRMETAFLRALQFSEDGARAAWIPFEPYATEPHVMVADLGPHASGVVRIRVPVPPGAISALALSPDGSQAAVIQEQQATLFSLVTGQPSASVPAAGGTLSRVAFAGNNRVRLVRRDEATGRLDLIVLDGETRRSTVTGHIPARGYAVAHWSPNRDRLAIVDQDQTSQTLSLHDGSSGALLATLLNEDPARRLTPTFLRDGRIAAIERGRVLRVFTRDGAAAFSVDIPATSATEWVAEVTPGVVAVVLPYQGPQGRSDSVLVDAVNGRVLRREEGLHPASRWMNALGDDARPAGGLFIDESGALVRLDVATGGRTRLVPERVER